MPHPLRAVPLRGSRRHPPLPLSPPPPATLPPTARVNVSAMPSVPLPCLRLPPNPPALPRPANPALHIAYKIVGIALEGDIPNFQSPLPSATTAMDFYACCSFCGCCRVHVAAAPPPGEIEIYALLSALHWLIQSSAGGPR